MEITIQPAYQEPEAIRELLVEYTGMLLEQNPAFAGYLKQQNFAAELDNLRKSMGCQRGGCIWSGQMGRPPAAWR